MSFQPLSDRVLVTPDPVEEKSEGGIILAQSEVTQAPISGEVIAIGKGRFDSNGCRINMDVKPGDKVTWGKFAGGHVVVDGDEYLLMRESDITGIVDSNTGTCMVDKDDIGCAGGM